MESQKVDQVLAAHWQRACNIASAGKSVLDPYKERFLGWWNDGRRQPLLMSLLQQQGYEGSLRTVTRYIS